MKGTRALVSHLRGVTGGSRSVVDMMYQVAKANGYSTVSEAWSKTKGFVSQASNLDTIVVGENDTKIGYSETDGFGSASDTHLKRLSITKGNNRMFFDYDPLETHPSITIRINGMDTALPLTSGKFAENVSVELRAYFDANLGKEISYEVITP